MTGTVRATIRQNCGVSLEPFDAPLNEMVDVHFVPAGTAIPSESLEDEDHDLPDEILDGRIDVGALALEFLALGVDPYPRKPDAVFIAPEPEPGALSPFRPRAPEGLNHKHTGGSDGYGCDACERRYCRARWQGRGHEPRGHEPFHFQAWDASGAGIAVDHIATHKILAVRPGMYSELKLGTQTRVTWLFAFLQRSAADMKASFR